MSDGEYTLDELQELATGLIDYYSDRNVLFSHMDDLFYSRWEKPEGLPEWVLKVVSTDPHDAVLTAVRTFATLEPRFKIMPMLPNADNRDRANQIEKALLWNFHQAGRRNDSKIVWDVMFSATQYAEVCSQVIYLPYQEKVLQAMGKDTKRLQALKRFGDFAFITHNPANVYPEWSEYGLEGVLTVRVQSVDEFMDTWGKLANPIVDTDAYNSGRVTFVTSFDYTTYEKRCVWGVYNDISDRIIRGEGIKILEEPNELGFIPYAIRRWGNSLSTVTRERVMPLLQSVWDSGQWDMLNVFDSLDASLTIKRAAAARFAAEVPSNQEIELDSTEPESVIKLPNGTRNFQPLPGNSVDQRISQNKSDYKARIWQSTVARALQTLEFPSGTAYSSVNQILSTASKSLAFYQLVGQHAMEEIAHQMLCWIKYYGKKYGTVDLYGKYMDQRQANYGQDIRIASDTIDPDILQIECILTADMPVDRLQQINGAVMLKNNFRIPEGDLIEDLGYGDPNDLANRRDLEDYERAYVQTDLQKIQMQAQLEMQQAQMQMQMQAQQAQQQQAQAMQMQQQQGQQQQDAAMQAQAAQGGAPANDQTQGLMNNPSAGGNPPVTVAGSNGAGG